MKYWIPLALLAISASIPTQPTSAQTIRDTARRARPDFSEARRLIRDWMARDSVPGLAVAVGLGDSILWEEGFGWADREGRVPATEHTPFYLASVTKTIIATGMMILRERGRLDLDRQANDYLGESRLWSPAWNAAEATVRSLATHTSGLTTFDLGCAPEPPACHFPDLAEIIRRYGVLVWRPGEHFDYSNLGYNVLGEVVARAAGRDLGSFLREELFRPLGMRHSSLGVDPTLAPQTALQYSWTRGALPLPSGAAGASGGYASAHDLVLFGAFHAKVRRPGVPAVLSDASIDTMQHAVVPAVRDQGYGLGWWVEEDRLGYRSILAQGGTNTAQAWLRVVPSERIAVVLLVNKGVGFPSDVVDAVLSALLPRYAELRAVQQAQVASGGATQPVPAPTRLDSSFVGRWSGIVRAEDGDLPLELAVTDSGTVSGTIGSRSGVRSGRARYAGTLFPLFRLAIPGDLDTSDSTAGLAFYLRPRNGALNGLVTTRPHVASGFEGRVSYWVELRKRP